MYWWWVFGWLHILSRVVVGDPLKQMTKSGLGDTSRAISFAVYLFLSVTRRDVITIGLFKEWVGYLYHCLTC